VIDLLGIVSLLLLLGGIGAHVTRAFSRADDDGAMTWGTKGSLSAAFAATIGLIVLAIRQLVACGGGAGCNRPAVVLPLSRPAPGLPSLALSVRVDPTAAIFLLLIGTCGACVAVYSFGWLHGDPLRNRVAGSFSLFLLAMVLVVVANSIFWLLIGLELMTFCSGDLVRYRGASGGPVEASRTAVRTYLIVSHLALMSVLVGVLPIIVSHHTLNMSVLSGAGGSPAPAFSFSFILLGLAMRAGVTPFHFWVPTVHPQLPTNTHAMVSAVMLKIPIYLMLRFFLGGIVGPVQWWWGVVVLVLAGLTAVVTVFYALVTPDLKVALAYHSVENVGIILAGLGLALLFSDSRFANVPGVRVAAALALLASLYHVMNHGLFKSLLFLCVGSVERQTGTVELHRLGGLCRTLPWTAFAFLIGAVAIADLPPLNGFVSTWLTVQALFSGQQVYLEHSSVALVILPAEIVALVALALAFATTALAFVKIAGQALLGEPRGALASGREPWSMRTIMTALSGLCLLLGLQPWLLVPWLTAALAPLHYAMSGLVATPTRLTISIPAAQRTVQYHATLPVLPLLLLVASAFGLTALLRAWRWKRRPVWVGGSTLDPSAIRYSGNAVSALLWEPMSRLRPWRGPAEPAVMDGQPVPAGVTGPADGTYPPDQGDQADRPAMPFREAWDLSPTRSVPEVANYFYNRLISRVITASYRFGRWFQNGDVRSYLLYMFVVVLLVLAVLSVTR
jgi:formate hydrogenlyase subunit 3/multisubunit Na+/H+ antiporter MnhD subunit